MRFLFKILLISAMVSLLGEAAYCQQRLGDNLGNHKATQNLNLNNKNILSASGVVIGGSSMANSSVGLQIDGSKALLLSRVTSLGSITAPVSGMMVYNSTDNKLYVYQNGLWTTYGSAALASGKIFIGSSTNVVQPVTVSGDLTLSVTGQATIGAGKVVTSTIADGAVGSAAILDGEIKTANIASLAINTPSIADYGVTTDDLAATAITLGKIADNAVVPSKISSTTAGPNKILVTDASSVLSYTDNNKRILPVMSPGQIIVGNSAGVPTAVAVNGDITINTSGAAAIKPQAVTTAMVLDGTIAAIDIADNAVTADKISSATKGPNKVLKTDATGAAGWYDKTTNSNGYNVGDIKAYLPTFLNAPTPSGWVDCNGQVLSDPASPLNGKTIPDLNNNTYLVGSTGETGQAIGTNSRFLAASNLPNVTLTGTLSTASAGLPAGLVTLTEAGSHNHNISDPGHQHGISTNLGGWNNGTRMQVSDRSIDGYVQLDYSTTGISINAGGSHTHAASFAGNSLGSHTHTDVIAGAINGGVSQTGIDVRPNSVTVRWIMKVK
jgi:hypothetical protein